MDVIKAIKTRRTIRHFIDKPVSEDALKNVIDAARWAPSACNRQGWRFIVIKDKNQIDRLEKAGVSYSIAGENLALAPTVQTAHTGLMNSEGHRANILEPQFKRVGIGVIDNGIYGKMFVQIFTD